MTIDFYHGTLTSKENVWSSFWLIAGLQCVCPSPLSALGCPPAGVELWALTGKCHSVLIREWMGNLNNSAVTAVCQPAPPHRNMFLVWQKPPHGFQKKMKLEAVDKRNPLFIRVATVADTDDHRIKVSLVCPGLLVFVNPHLKWKL